MRQSWTALFAGLLLLVGGCASYPRAQNPLPGVYRVAVVDFADKSNGAAGLDSRRVTEIFASELQKIPTYEVVPVQEVREVLGPARIDTNQPQLAFELARAVHAQAIIVGSINEYSAHYPPRLALHCEMYAMVTGEPEAVVVSPPIAVEPNRQPMADLLAPLGMLAMPVERATSTVKTRREKHRCGHCRGCKLGKACDACGPWWARPFHRLKGIRYESSPLPPSSPHETPVDEEVAVPEIEEEQARYRPSRGGIRAVSAEEPLAPETMDAGHVDVPFDTDALPPVVSSGSYGVAPGEEGLNEYLRGDIADYRVSVRQPVDPIPVVEPWVIRHSRVFDGTNVGLTRKLRDYIFFADDIRGGDWKGYVLRNDDFIRFSCNQMIYEMLESAGGDWMTLRGLRLPKPWEPWPPR